MEYAEILALLAQYKYYIVFPLLVFQGPIVALAAGFLASKGMFALLPLYALVIMADIGNDIAIYAAARWGRWTIIARWGRYIGLTDRRIERADIFMEKHGGKALALGKIAYTLGAPTIALAGIARMNFLKFFLICMVVTVPKSIILVLLGYYLGTNINVAEQYLNYVGIGALTLVIIAGAIYWRKRNIGNQS